MSRALPEWIGEHDDVRIPPRVRARVFEKFGGICQCGCGLKIRAGDLWDVDHIVALINGGEHREGNMQPLLAAHHREKTKADVAVKSKTADMRAKHFGMKQAKHPMPCGRNSPWKKTMSGKVVLR